MTRLLVLSPGDTREQLLLFPALKALSGVVSQIDLVVQSAAKDVYQLCPSVHDTYVFNFSARKGLADWSNLYGKIREKEYDAAITTTDSLPVRCLLWLLGISPRIGVTGGTAEFLLSHAVPAQEHLPRVQAYSSLLSVLSPELNQGTLAVKPSDKDLAWSQSTYEGLSLGDGSDCVILYDESLESGYPQENWESVVMGLRDRKPEIKLALLETPQNQDWVATLRDNLLGIAVIQAKSLSQAAAVIQPAQALVSTDSSPLYLGVGTQTKTIGLFGSTKPDQLGADGDRLIGLRASSAQLKDITPIQVIESLIESEQ